VTKKRTKRAAARKTAPAKVATKAAEAPKRQEVSVAAAKGRPMLTWVGKRPLKRVTAFPAQRIETFNPQGEMGEWQNLLFHGDNKEVLAYLLVNGFRGKVNLIYIDPPFDSGADYVRKVQLRGAAGTAKIDGETYTLGEQIQYTDIWANDNYLQFMYERFLLLKELLANIGTLCVHADTRRAYILRVLLDEVFGADNFMNEIAWQRTTAHADTKERYGEIHDTLMLYRKGISATWNQRHLPYSEEYLDAKYSYLEPVTGRRYRLSDMTAPEPRANLEYEWRGVRPPAGRHWAVEREEMERYDQEGRIVQSKNGMLQYKRYLDEMKGVPLQDMWTDIPPVNPMADEKLGYPTQKPEGLIERFLLCSTNEDDLALDCFIGSGTTAAVAQKHGRRWIGCDINKGAIQVTAKRLQTIIREQMEAQRQGSLLAVDAKEAPKPASLAFSVYRVNDYDLAIQHNEAVNLACEHLGVQRMRTDAYFDGTQGKKLVKIVPLAHPLTLLDLEELERELKSRPKEDRDVMLVCLGKEPAVDGWLAERTRHRPVNKIEVVELRTDKKYGKFFTHRPATARVDIKRAKEKIVVEIKDFISPSIVERLNMDQSLFKAQITDWRAMVDSVMVDTAYDGQVFNVVLSDVPERKADLVAGRYELPAPDGPTSVAVKITDMLGEEVLVTKRLE
jgi:adenine-specific DNA-methyltransferase